MASLRRNKRPAVRVYKWIDNQYHCPVYLAYLILASDTIGRFSSLIQKDNSKPKKAIAQHANHIWLRAGKVWYIWWDIPYSYISTNNIVADKLIKSLEKVKFQRFIELLDMN